MGGDRIPPIAGPILPSGSPQVWIGGTQATALGVAARAADAWNGWGLDRDTFLERAGELSVRTREEGRAPGEVPPTWAGIVLVGRDNAELDTLERERSAKGSSMEVWRGTTDDLRSFRDDLAAAGATWLIVLAAGPTDRVELIAETLRSG